MKKLLISVLLVLALSLSAMLVPCDGDGEYDDSESRQPVESHEDDTGSGSESGSESGSAGDTEKETEKETDSALGVVEDTEEGWGEVHH